MKMEVIESGMVAPSEETPQHKIWLSNLDLPPIPREYTPTVYLYRPNGDPDFFSVERLKAGLSKALVPFYPLAGRLEVDENGRPQINCTGEGALLTVVQTESNADDEFGGWVPSPELKKALVPSAESAEPPCMLLMVQVTFFKSGDVTLGIANHHTPQDGHSALRFINAWADMARIGAADLKIPLSFDRSPLRARCIPPTPVLIDHIEQKHDHSDDISDPMEQPLPEFVVAYLHLSEEQINTLKNKDDTTTTNNKKLSTFLAITAHMWRSMCIARGLAPDQDTQLNTVVNVRSRLNPPLPSGFFGCAIVPTSASAKVEEVVSGSLESVAQKIREASARLDDEYVRSQIDFLEMLGNKPLKMGGCRGTDLVVVSWLGMPIYEADFGWGRPEIMIRAEVPPGGGGCLMNNRPGSDEGGVTIIMSMESEIMEGFKEAFYQLV